MTYKMEVQSRTCQLSIKGAAVFITFVFIVFKANEKMENDFRKNCIKKVVMF
jgi:hypothetical protein